MKKEIMVMEAIGHCDSLLKVYDYFDKEDDGTLYIVSSRSVAVWLNLTYFIIWLP
jgi:hypothetical protein